MALGVDEFWRGLGEEGHAMGGAQELLYGPKERSSSPRLSSSALKAA